MDRKSAPPEKALRFHSGHESRRFAAKCIESSSLGAQLLITKDLMVEGGGFEPPVRFWILNADVSALRFSAVLWMELRRCAGCSIAPFERRHYRNISVPTHDPVRSRIEPQVEKGKLISIRRPVGVKFELDSLAQPSGNGLAQREAGS